MAHRGGTHEEGSRSVDNEQAGYLCNEGLARSLNKHVENKSMTRAEETVESGGKHEQGNFYVDNQRM